MVSPLPCAVFRNERAAAEEVVVSVHEVWGGGFTCLIKEKYPPPSFIQSVANFTFSDSNKANCVSDFCGSSDQMSFGVGSHMRFARRNHAGVWRRGRGLCFSSSPAVGISSRARLCFSPFPARCRQCLASPPVHLSAPAHPSTKPFLPSALDTLIVVQV